MEILLPRAKTPRCPDGRPDCLSRRQLAGPTPVSHETAPVAHAPETAGEVRR
ncbi:MAG TPA: hypothetical protein VKQ29_02200 [Aliidongia sp.]|nr:hypothetical protein [Aliidongia sp.]